MNGPFQTHPYEIVMTARIDAAASFLQHFNFVRDLLSSRISYPGLRPSRRLYGLYGLGSPEFKIHLSIQLQTRHAALFVSNCVIAVRHLYRRQVKSIKFSWKKNQTLSILIIT